MLIHSPNLKIWFYTQPTDMRKQFDGLAALAKNKMNGHLNNDNLFVFLNRKRTQIKILYYSTGGLCLWSKRLEQGQFQELSHDRCLGSSLYLTWSNLQCLIDGINWRKAPQLKRFKAAV